MECVISLNMSDIMGDPNRLADKIALLNESVTRYFDTINIRRELVGSVEQEEIIIQRAIRSLASILSLKFITKHQVELERFPRGSNVVLSGIDLMMNVYNLPVAFSAASRATALKAIGTICASIGNIGDKNAEKYVQKIAKIIEKRNVERDSLLMCAHLKLLSRAAINSESMRSLVHCLEGYLKDLEKRPRETIIAFCKAARRLDQATETITKRLHFLATTSGTEMGVSAYATVAWLVLSHKRGVSIRVNSILDSCEKTLSTQQSNNEALKACVKCVYIIAQKHSDAVASCCSILQAFMEERTVSFARDRAFLLLARMSVRLQDTSLQRMLMTLGITHIESAVSTRVLVPKVLHGVCIIAMANRRYSKQVFNLCMQVLRLGYFDYPGAIFEFMMAYRDDGVESEQIDAVGDDIFDTIEIPVEVDPDAAVIHEWRRTSRRVPVLYSIDMFACDAGFLPPLRVNSPDATIYEDVVACFTMAVSHPRYYGTTLPALLRRLQDTQPSESRVIMLWEEIRDMMGEYAVVSYCQLLFGLILSGNLCSEEFLRRIIRELEWCFTNMKERQSRSSPVPVSKPSRGSSAPGRPRPPPPPYRRRG